MIIPIIIHDAGEVIVGKGLLGDKVADKTLISSPSRNKPFRGAFYCWLYSFKKGKYEARVGFGTVNGIIPYIGKTKLDDKDPERVPVEEYSEDGYAWILVRVKTDKDGQMTAKKKEYQKEDLEIVSGTTPKKTEKIGENFFSEHAIAMVRNPDKEGGAGIANGIWQIVYFDLQHWVAMVNGSQRHFFL